MIRLLIADDHPIVREGLKRIVLECDDMELVAEAEDGDEMFAKCTTEHNESQLIPTIVWQRINECLLLLRVIRCLPSCEGIRITHTSLVGRRLISPRGRNCGVLARG